MSKKKKSVNPDSDSVSQELQNLVAEMNREKVSSEESSDANPHVTHLAALAAASRALFEEDESAKESILSENTHNEEAFSNESSGDDESSEQELAGFEGSELDGFEEDAVVNLVEEESTPALEEVLAAEEAEIKSNASALEGTELDQYESATIEQIEFIEDEKVESIIESILFSTDRPISLNAIKMAFKGTQVTTDKIKKTLDRLAVEYAGARRGISLDEAPGGYQLRTKLDNIDFLRRTVKARPFKLSGPALEVLAIAAYKQPLIKNEIDQIRGVESGHLLRALMERGLVQFEGKSDLPGRPMYYGTTKKFLEIFGLRSLKELPTLSQIDELLPEGMDEEEADKPQLSQITDSMSQSVSQGSYSDGEEELVKIQEQLAEIDTTSEFFEKEKQRQKEERDRERAQSIREALALAEVTKEVVPDKDIRWLKKYDEALIAAQNQAEAAVAASADGSVTSSEDESSSSTEMVSEEGSPLFDEALSSEEGLDFVEDSDESESEAGLFSEDSSMEEDDGSPNVSV